MPVVRWKSKAATVASICCKTNERRTERLINSDVYQEPPKIPPLKKRINLKEFDAD